MLFELVIPCYNEEKSLPFLIERAARAASDAGLGPRDFQLIVVDNGSTDATDDALDRLQQTELVHWFRIVHVYENRGYGDGIYQGLKASVASYVGWSHADGQCDPADAFRALTALRESPAPSRTLVKGSRTGRAAADYTWSRFFEIASFILLRTPLWEVNAQPKVFDRMLLEELVDPPPDFAFDLYALYRARRCGWKIRTIPVVFGPRLHGVSHWAFSIRSRFKTALIMLRYMAELRRKERKPGATPHK